MTDALTEDPRPDGLRSAPSLVLVNTGDGKGKSSSAFGVMLRALAVDWHVAVCQFIKSSEWQVGEEKIGRQLGVEWRAFGDGFTWDSDNIDTDIAHARAEKIDVHPPDVNESKRDFTVVAEGIRFGLAGVKNVGEGAIEAILEARAEAGRFSDLFDFCHKAILLVGGAFW